MSFRFNWSRLDDAVAETIRQMINDQLQAVLESKLGGAGSASTGSSAAGDTIAAPGLAASVTGTAASAAAAATVPRPANEMMPNMNAAAASAVPTGGAGGVGSGVPSLLNVPSSGAAATVGGMYHHPSPPTANTIGLPGVGGGTTMTPTSTMAGGAGMGGGAGGRVTPNTSLHVGATAGTGGWATTATSVPPRAGASTSSVAAATAVAGGASVSAAPSTAAGTMSALGSQTNPLHVPGTTGGSLSAPPGTSNAPSVNPLYASSTQPPPPSLHGAGTASPSAAGAVAAGGPTTSAPPSSKSSRLPPLQQLCVSSLEWGTAPPFIEIVSFENAREFPTSPATAPAPAATAPATTGTSAFAVTESPLNPPLSYTAFTTGAAPATASSSQRHGGTSIGPCRGATGLTSTGVAGAGGRSSLTSPHVKSNVATPGSGTGGRGFTTPVTPHLFPGADSASETHSSAYGGHLRGAANTATTSTATTTMAANAVGGGSAAASAPPSASAFASVKTGGGGGGGATATSGGHHMTTGSGLHSTSTTAAPPQLPSTPPHPSATAAAPEESEDADGLARFLGPDGLFVRLHVTYGGSLRLAVSAVVQYAITFGPISLPVRMPLSLHVADVDLDCYVCVNLHRNECRLWLEPGQLSSTPLNRLTVTAVFGEDNWPDADHLSSTEHYSRYGSSFSEEEEGAVLIDEHEVAQFVTHELKALLREKMMSPHCVRIPLHV